VSLFRGCHVVKLDTDGQPMMSSEREVHVEWEVIQLSESFQARDESGEFNHVEQLVLLRKVR